MKQKLAKLIDLKSIVTIMITATLIYGFITNKIDSQDFMLIVAMIFTFYFSKKKDGEIE
jgi:hypothetical protein